MKFITKAKAVAKKARVVFTAGAVAFALAATAVAAGATGQIQKVYAYCDRVNIIYCGLPGGHQDVINRLKSQYQISNDNGHRDIRAVLQWGGFDDSKINNMNTGNTKMGVLNRAGEIWVGNRKVAYDTSISARYSSGAGFWEIMPGVWARRATTQMSGDNRPVLVWFNEQGNARAAVMTDCGNALRFLPIDLVPKVKIDKKINGVEETTVKPNQNFTYQLRVSNPGQTTLRNAYVLDVMPAGVQLLGTDRGQVVNNSLQYTIPELRVGQYIDINLTAKATKYGMTHVKNTACVNTPEVNPGQPNNWDDCNDAWVNTPAPIPGVKIEKTINNQEEITTETGREFTYELRVTNTGQMTLKSVAVRDAAPAGVTFRSTTVGTISGNVLTHTIPELAVGQTATIYIRAVANDMGMTRVKNTACVDAKEVNPGSTTPDDCDDAYVNTPAPKPGITIVKTVDNVEKKTVEVGQGFTYQITVKNTGNQNLVNTVVRDTAPTGVALLGADKGVINANTWTYTIPTLAPGATVNFNLTAKVAEYRTGDMVNTACVDAKEVNPGSTTADACDDATVNVPVRTPGIKIEKTINNKEEVTLPAGREFTYELRVTNTGNFTLKNVVVTDRAPADVVFRATTLGTIGGNALNATISELPAGQTVSILIRAVAEKQGMTHVKNTACVDAKEVNPSSTTPDACDDAFVNTPVPAITIVKTVDGVEKKTVAVGQNFTYQVTVKNTGSQNLTNVVVRDNAPAGVTLLSADKGTVGANVWTYTIPSLASGSSATFKLTAKVAEYRTGDMVNTACVNAPEVNPAEPGKDDACDTATVNVPVRVPGITIIKTVDGVEKKTVAVGQNFTYQVTVKNTGNFDLTNVVISDKAPAGVTLVSAAQGNISANTWTHTIGTLKTGETATFNLTAKVAEYRAGDMVNTACVDAPEVPGAPDKCDDATVNVPKPLVPAVAITKTVEGVKQITVNVGEEFDYMVTVKNTGEVKLTNVLVTDTPQAGIVLTAAGNGTIINNTWKTTVAELKVGESKTFTLTAKVKDYSTAYLVNTACVNAPEVNPTKPAEMDACDKANVNTQAKPAPKTPSVTVTKKVNNVKAIKVDANQVFTYQLMVRNNGQVDLTNVAVKDTPDAGIILSEDVEFGTVSGNMWSYTIPSLKIGESKTFTLSAKVTAEDKATYVNTVCVDAPEVNPTEPGKNDACDYANVSVDTPPVQPPAPVEPTPPTPVTPEVPDYPQQVLPAVLPNTGAGQIAMIAAVVAVLGGVVYRFTLGRAARR